MKNLFFLGGLLITLTSCNPLGKSISEELTVEEIKSAVDNDSLFDVAYKMIEMFKEVNENDKLVLAKHSELTYQQFLDYQRFLNNKEFWDKKKMELENEWTNTHETSFNKGLEYIQDWQKKRDAYEIENDPSKHVKIELSGVETEYYTYSGGVQDVYFYFRLTPLKGRVEQAIWSINPTAKINGEPDKTTTSWILNQQRYIYSRPFSKRTGGRYEADYSHRDLAAGKNSKSFLRDYNLNLEIRKVRVNGKNYEPNAFELPKLVKSYLDEVVNPESSMTDYYLEKIIQENIEAEYISKSKFVTSKSDEIKQEMYPLIWDFAKDYLSSVIKSESDDLLKKMQDIFK